jgi:integrase
MAEKRIRLTKAAIDALPDLTHDDVGKVGYRIFWDRDLVGFGVQVRPSGTKTFILVYRNRHGRVRRLTIGRYGRLTVDQARDAAKQHNGRVALGGDPAAEKKRDREAKTLDEVFERYIDEHLIPNRSDQAVRSAKRVRRLIEKGMGADFVTEIKQRNVRTDLERLRNKPGNYNLVRTYTAAAWNWAQGLGVVKDDARNPVDGIDALPSQPRARLITEAEYRTVFQAIDELMAERRNDPARLLACAFVIATGCRPIEAVRLRRDRVNRLRGTAELLEHKTFSRTRTPKQFFLTPLVLEILDRANALHEMRRTASEFVFPRRTRQKPSNWLAKTWNSIRRRAKVDIELRQFRSGYINLADDLGMTENLIAEITQHASPETVRRHYLAIKPKRASANANRVASRIEQFRAKVAS